MHRIDGPAAAPGGFFTDGDPSVGTPATVVTDDWANAVQEELAAVIEATGAALAKPDNTQLLDAIRTLVAAALPPGAVQGFAVSVVPAGWLECDGGTFVAAAHPALAAALGATWGAAPAGEIRLPDLRGEFPRGWDHGRGVDSGRAFASAQDWATAAPKNTDPSKLVAGGGTTGLYAASNPSTVGFVRASKSGEAVTATGFDSNSSGVEMDAYNAVAGDAETRPRNVTLLYCIKV